MKTERSWGGEEGRGRGLGEALLSNQVLAWPRSLRFNLLTLFLFVFAVAKAATNHRTAMKEPSLPWREPFQCIKTPRESCTLPDTHR